MSAAPHEVKLFVGGLSWEVDDKTLSDTFADYGEVTFCRVATDKNTQRSRGFGFVSFKEEACASKAISELNGHELNGRAIELKYAVARAGASIAPTSSKQKREKETSEYGSGKNWSGTESSKLFVGGLSWKTGDDELYSAFEGFGEITSAYVCTHPVTGQSRKFGFVLFASPADATKAEKKMQSSTIDGSVIRVNFSDTGGGAGASAKQEDKEDEAGARAEAEAGGGSHMSQEELDAFKAQWPFDTAWNDHFETPLAAYQDVAPVLTALSVRKRRARLGKQKVNVKKSEERFRVYDPYYCKGKTKEHIAAVGFPKVINKRRDFYADVAAGTVPAHDILLTNPPYSDDHKEKLLAFILERQRRTTVAGEVQEPLPFMLLLPSWTASKGYWRKFLKALCKLQAEEREAAGEEAEEEEEEDNDDEEQGSDSADGAGDLKIERECGVFYVYPGQGDGGNPAYDFAHPAGTGHQSCPFDGIWFCGGMGLARGEKGYGKGLAKGEKEVAKALKEVAKAVGARGTGGGGGKVASQGAVARSLADLQTLGLVRSAEAVKERYEKNPKQKQLRDEALAKRKFAKKMSGQVRKRDYKRRKVWKQGEGPEGSRAGGDAGGDWGRGGKWQQDDTGDWGEEGLWQDPTESGDAGTKADTDAGGRAGAKKEASADASAGGKAKPVCRHFLSDKGCHRGFKCRFSHGS
jgi:hypothetical protein